MGQKLLIVLLVVLVVVFAITLALGASHGSGTPSADHPGAAGGLKGLQGGRFLVLGDKASTSCPVTSTNPTVLSVSGSCAISVEKRSLFSTATRVAFAASGAVGVDVQTKGLPDQAGNLPDDHGNLCFGSAVDHNGGTITLSAFPSTTITLLTAACPPS